VRRPRRLADAGVPTPEIVAYAVYPAFGPFARADVATRALDGRDFPEAWRAAADDDLSDPDLARRTAPDFAACHAIPM